MMRKTVTRSAILIALLLTCAVSRAAEGLNGTWTIQGTKGAIVLTLKPDAEGRLEGALKGGQLSLVLNGFPREDGSVLGTARTPDGEMKSYFVATRQGDKVLLDLIEVGADGDPDMTKKQTIAFPNPGDATTKNPATTDNADNALADGEDAAPSAAKSFAGTFKGDNLILESRAQDNDYVGTITLGGQKFPFTGTGVNGTLHGTFETGGERFDFTGNWQKGKLVLTSGEATYQLQKQGGASNPLGKTKTPAKNPLDKARPIPDTNKPVQSPSGDKPMSRPAGAPKGGAAWKTFKHPVGLSLRYPPTWTVKDAGRALLLSPPDVAQVGGGPAEIFIVKADSAGAIRSGDDPQLEQTIAQDTAKLFPNFQRMGETKAIRAGNQPGIVMEWEGETQGHAMRLQVLATVLKSFTVGMLAISIKDQIKPSRDATIKQIFESLVAGAGERDPQAVGKWFLYSYKGSGSYGRETKSYMTLLPDGTALWGQQSESSFSSDSGSFASQGNNGDRGSWSAGKGQLIVAWGDGTTATWNYRVGTGTGAGRRLFLKGSNGKEDEWMER